MKDTVLNLKNKNKKLKSKNIRLNIICLIFAMFVIYGTSIHIINMITDIQNNSYFFAVFILCISSVLFIMSFLYAICIYPIIEKRYRIIKRNENKINELHNLKDDYEELIKKTETNKMMDELMEGVS